MEEKKTTKAAEPKKPSAAALKTALAQLEEEESGKKKNTVIFRILAFVCWALAAVAMYCPQLGDKMDKLPFGAMRMLGLNNIVEFIICAVVAAVLCIVAARLWIHANHIHPTKSHNKVVQFIWNQLGVIMAGLIFAPIMIYLIVNNKKLEKKTKIIAAAVLAVLFLGTSAASADYHPVTQDQVNSVLSEAQENGYIEGEDGVRWTKYGRCYHLFKECPTLQNSAEENCTDGDIDDAVNSNRVRLCEFCRKAYEKAKEDGTLEQLLESKIDAPVKEPAADPAPVDNAGEGGNE